MARHANTGFGAALLRNPLIIGTAAGLACNLLGLTVPAWLDPTVQRIGASSKVLSASLLTLRHLVGPLVAWVLVRWFRLDAVQSTVLFAFSALPTAPTAYVLASRMGYNGPYVAGLVTLSTVLGVFSLRFALGVLR